MDDESPMAITRTYRDSDIVKEAEPIKYPLCNPRPVLLVSGHYWGDVGNLVKI